MGRFKRFCMIVFALAGLVGTGVLAVLWFAWKPAFPALAWLAEQPWFFAAETSLIIITAAGLISILVRAITAPGLRANLTLERNAGSIAITQSALQSTVKHVVEARKGMSVERVRTHIVGGREPRLSVQVRIDPGTHTNLAALGDELRSEVATALVAFTGYPVEAVRITFSGTAKGITSELTAKSQQASRAARGVHTRRTPARVAD